MSKTNGHKPQRFRVPPKRTAILKFTDGDYEGAEVTCSLDVSTGIILDFQRIGEELSEADFDALLRKFGRYYLLSWNLEDNDGDPIPATAEGMSVAPTNFTVAMIQAWSDAVLGMSDPLELPLSNGLGSAAKV